MRHLTIAAVAALLLAAAPAARAQDDAKPATTRPAETDAKTVHVLIKTNKGDIVLELDPVKAPKTVANFLDYVDREYYDGTIFHRVIPTFMIQGGGFTRDMTKKETSPPVVNEWRNGLKNLRGTIAMARLGGRPDSATSQFFINVVDNAFLDRPQQDGAAYAVFGRVVKGMDVVDRIKAEPTRAVGGHQNVPVEPVVIESVRRMSEGDVKKLAG